MLLSGSQILLECLLEQGVDTIFGYPGGCVLNIYDELYRYQDKIRHILTSHEQGASHAADGYARSTGKVGVCMATSGPGATNLVTGIATAYMDSIPLIAITGNVAVNILGKDSFQEVDIAGVVMPITKHSFIVKDITKLADTVRRAFKIAQSGRPGPVLIDITKDVTAAKTDYIRKEPEKIEPVMKRYKEEDLLAGLDMIKHSKRPMIMVGGGAISSGASEEIRKFVELVDAPVCDTLMGKGAFNGDAPYYVGMIGMHGTKTANLSVSECDLLIVLGARFSDRVTGNTSAFAKNAKILQIDVDPAEINKNVTVDQSIIGDLREIVSKLNEKLDHQYHMEWLSKVIARKDAFPMTYPKDCLTGPYIIEKINDITSGDAIITTEVGQHQMWAAQFYQYQAPRRLLTSGGLGTMGYGLGASIGAKIGNPNKVVINIAGDGCFRMNMNEIATMVRYNLPIIQIVINNHVLGMVRQWQTLFYGGRYSSTVLDDQLDFVKVAKAMGAKAFHVETCDEFDTVIREAVAMNAPVVIDCQIGKDDKVFPMVEPGGSIEKAFDADDLRRKKEQEEAAKALD